MMKSIMCLMRLAPFLSVVAITANCTGTTPLKANDKVIGGNDIAIPYEISVELDVYAGRTNPSWQLTEEERNTLLLMLKNSQTTSHDALPNQLGYRGVVLYSASSQQVKKFEIRIFDGVIRYKDDETIRYWKDTDRSIERWLVTIARPHIDPQLHDYISTQLR